MNFRRTDCSSKASGLNERGDCTVRAVAAALRIAYSDAHAKLGTLGRNNGHGFRFREPQVKALGFEALPEYSCKTWRTISRELPPTGSFIVRVRNHVRCHLAVVALLDRAKELGCLAEVSDEGGFWDKRNVPALVQEVGSWNEMIAALGGKLKDLLGDGTLGLESAIAQYPNLEQLEAAGQAKLPAGVESLVELIRRVTPRSGSRG